LTGCKAVQLLGALAAMLPIRTGEHYSPRFLADPLV
jgi:hypothetical protein